MSISEFLGSMKTKAGQQVAEKMLKDLVDSSTARFKQGGINRDASILTQGSYKTTGNKGESKTVQLSENFRTSGEAQGRTRLVVTEDFLNEMFRTLNISSEDTPMKVYTKFLLDTYGSKYKAKHFEFYSRDGTVQEFTKNSKTQLGSALDGKEDLVAIRALNFSHKNTLEHIAIFLISIKKFPDLATARNTLSTLYERGHVYAQTTGRALASLDDADSILGKIIQLSAFIDEESSSLKDENKYKEILGRARKDFTSRNLFMNVELQLKTSNQDTGRISGLLRVVGLLQSLVDNVKTSANGSRLLSTPVASSLSTLEKQLQNFLQKIEKVDTASAREMAKIVSQSSDPNFLLNLRTSKNVLEHITDIVVDTITSGTSKSVVKVNTGEQLLKEFKIPNAPKIGSMRPIALEANLIRKKVKEVKAQIAKSVKVPKIRDANTGKFTSLASLQSLLNSALRLQIQKNMGSGGRKDILNYRTGRFASSAKVENMSQSREGMITAFYSYMKNPYQTFEPGSRQGSTKSRDPKLLIAKSIREIASTMVGNRLRAVRL